METNKTYKHHRQKQQQKNPDMRRYENAYSNI